MSNPNTPHPGHPGHPGHPSPPRPRPGFDRRDPKAEELLADIGGKLKLLMPPGYGFTLLIARLDQSEVYYLSNVDRGDSVMMLAEISMRMLEESRNPPDPPDHDHPEPDPK